MSIFPHPRLSALDPIETAGRYPALFRPADWRVVQVRFELRPASADDGMISNVNLVPRVGDDWLIIRLGNGSWSLPGGTREPGEPLVAALRRELLEEAGAELVRASWIGAWRCRSRDREPHRPHVPHPVFYRAVAVGEVRITGSPSNPPDGESITEVAALSLHQAARRLRACGRADLADLYHFAADLSQEVP